jgi:hypothetical protein
MLCETTHPIGGRRAGASERFQRFDERNRNLPMQLAKSVCMRATRMKDAAEKIVLPPKRRSR